MRGLDPAPSSSPAVRRGPARVPKEPLYPILFALVIASIAGLVVMLLVPAISAIGTGADRLRDRLAEETATFGGIPRFPERSKIYARDGSLLATIHFKENREIVRLKQIAPIAQRAVLAIEDHRFYEHGAINPSAVLRAFLANLAAGEITQGGSTITQQLVKNVTRQSETTLSRKFREMAVAMQIEREYTKDEILELYLNEVYLGNGVYGLGTASLYYFGKPAKKLTLAQAALLAGMIQRPEDYDPTDRPKAAEERRDQVIDRMESLRWITSEKADAARSAPVRLSKHIGTEEEVLPFFVRFVRDQIVKNETGDFDAFGRNEKQRIRTLFQGGLRIHTTLDPTWQRYAQEAARAQLPRPTDPDAALVTVATRSGAIRTMLSGKDFGKQEKNLVTVGRQPGSAFKPFTLVAAFREGYPPGKVYDRRSPLRLPEWDNDCHCVSNAEGGSAPGYIDLWAATQGSVNVVFAQLALDVGPPNIVEAAHDLGITTPLDAVPSITLGAEETTPLDMASAYATLANNGRRCDPFAVQRVERDDEVVYKHEPSCERVIEPDIARLVTAMLRGVVEGGTGRAAALGRPVAGKTGTAQDYTNAWFVGYTPQLSTAVWVGYPEGQIDMSARLGYTVYGGTIAAPIWGSYMARVVQGIPVQGFPPPPAPERGPVPKVVGMRIGRAQAVLAEADFTPQVQHVASTRPKGTVIAQAPRAGTQATLGALVHLSVSTGEPPKVWLPDVVGRTQEEAARLLRSRGFEVEIRRVAVANPQRDGLVLDQSPAGGTRAPEGSTVTLRVGRHEPPGGG